jgi:hypothetical protein
MAIQNSEKCEGTRQKKLTCPNQSLQVPLLVLGEEARGMPIVLGIVIPSLVAVVYLKRHNSDPECLRDRVVMFSGERRMSEGL